MFRIVPNTKHTCVHISQIDNNRRFVNECTREISVQTQWPGALKSDRLHPVGRLCVEDVQMGFGKD